MDFDWSKPFSEEVEGELPDIHIGSDKLDRGKYAEFLTDFLCSLDNQSYVMNLNAEWGAGKTYFLQRWYHTIKEDHPAVYIDAWKHDFSDEPLLAVISAISNYLKSKTPKKGAEKAKNLAEKGWRFSKKVAPELMSGITKKISGIDIAKFGDDEVQTISDLKYDGNDTNGAEDFSLFAGKIFEVALADHSEKVNELEFFKSAIQGWLKEVVSANESLSLPMFVFIDELDRCRPTYAIELLETVKHLFDIEGVVFVIATDTEQLQHSIKAVYGEGFDSSRYLCRFFDRSFSLRRSNVYRFIETRNVTKKLWEILEISCNGQVVFESRRKFIESLSALAESFRFSLRDIEQWLDQLLACFSNTVNKDKYFWVAIAVLLGHRFSNSENLNSLEELKPLSLVNSQYTINFTLTPKYLNQQIVTSSYYDSHFGEEIETRRKFDGRKERAITFKSESKLLGEIVNAFYEANIVQKAFDCESNERIIPAMAMIIQYGVSQYSVSIDNYIDLVEMASDLT